MGALFEEPRLFTTNGGSTTRLEVGGELDAGTTGALRERLALIVDAGTGDVDVDMSDVSFCDSTALCTLITAREQLRREGRRLRIVNPSSRVIRLFELAGVTDTFAAATGPSGPHPWDGSSGDGEVDAASRAS